MFVLLKSSPAILEDKNYFDKRKVSVNPRCKIVRKTDLILDLEKQIIGEGERLVNCLAWGSWVWVHAKWLFAVFVC